MSLTLAGKKNKQLEERVSVCDYLVCSVVPERACQLFVSELRTSGVGRVPHGLLCSCSAVL